MECGKNPADASLTPDLWNQMMQGFMVIKMNKASKEELTCTLIGFGIAGAYVCFITWLSREISMAMFGYPNPVVFFSGIACGFGGLAIIIGWMAMR